MYVELFKKFKKYRLGVTRSSQRPPSNNNKNYDLFDFFTRFGGLGRVTTVAKDAGVAGAAKCAVSGMPTALLTAGWRRTVKKENVSTGTLSYLNLKAAE